MGRKERHVIDGQGHNPMHDTLNLSSTGNKAVGLYKLVQREVVEQVKIDKGLDCKASLRACI